MTSSYYPVTTDNYFDRTQSKSMPSTSNYSSYQNLNNSYSDDDDDLDALRKAALKTLNSKKRKNNYDQSPIHRHSRSSSSSSQSSYTHSSISRSYSSSSSSLSSISSDSLDKNDKDYRFEIKEKASNGDIDERFPNDNGDMLIVNCPIQDEDLLIHDEQKKSTDHDERKPRKSNSKEVKRRKKSPSIEPPVSVTVKLNSDQFDLRQLIKKRRTEESSSSNQRVVQILPKDNQIVVHKKIHDRLSSSRSEKTHKH